MQSSTVPLIRAFIRTPGGIAVTFALGAIIYGTLFAKDYSAPSIVGDTVSSNLSANFCAQRERERERIAGYKYGT